MFGLSPPEKIKDRGFCNHVKIKLLVIEFDSHSSLYNGYLYTFCNVCACKLDEAKKYEGLKEIPYIERGDAAIVKTLGMVFCNDQRYAWFGHSGDWQNFNDNGSNWQ